MSLYKAIVNDLTQYPIWEWEESSFPMMAGSVYSTEYLDYKIVYENRVITKAAYILDLDDFFTLKDQIDLAKFIAWQFGENYKWTQRSYIDKQYYLARKLFPKADLLKHEVEKRENDINLSAGLIRTGEMKVQNRFGSKKLK